MTGAGTLALEPELVAPLVSADPEPELVAPLVSADPELPLLSVEVVAELEPAALLVDAPDVDPLVTAPGRERAGSCPAASWMKITDQANTNTVATIATVRRRISDARRLRAWSRSATRRRASRWPAGRWGDGEFELEDG